MPYASSAPDVVEKLLRDEPETVYVDVRSVPEFEQGHVPGAYNIPLLHMTPAGMQPNPAFLSAVTRRFPKQQKIVFGCKSGVRSARACEMLEQQGYSHLVNMAGGFHGAMDQMGRLVEKGWAACGHATTREAQPGRTWRELEK